MTTTDHNPDPENEGWCLCGGTEVYYEGDLDGPIGYGCDRAGTTYEPALALVAVNSGDPDEFQVPDDDTCGDCGCAWTDHQGGENGVTCSAHGCLSYHYVPEGWR